MNDRTARLARAREYPYRRPQHSFVWRGDRADPMDVDPFDPALTRGRTPVLAVGSNQSPEQLARKYGVGSRHVIPVERTTLRDFDVVYAAHLASYAAVPAMLQRAPGVEVELFVTWLDAEQVEIMHATEGHYHFAEIADITLKLESGSVRDRIFLYVARFGHFVHEGSSVSLGAVTARGRTNGMRTTAEMLQLVQVRLGVAGDNDEFVIRLAEDEDFRATCIERLSADAVGFGHPYRIIGP